MLNIKTTLATLALGSAMALLGPSVASAQDRDDYYRNGNGYSYSGHDRYYGRDDRWRRHEEHERLERLRRLERMERMEHLRNRYRRNGYYGNGGYGYQNSNGYYDNYGYWHQY
jgi:hypothetical protein